MGRDIVIHGPQGPVDAWRADPPEHAAALGAVVVVVQEIFGVNDHIRSVAEGFAAAGYAMSLGKRDFTSVTQTVATKYEVLCEHKVAARAREMLQQMPGARAAAFE